MAKNKKRKNKNKNTNDVIELDLLSSDKDVKNAILYAYFDDEKPQDIAEYHAFVMLTNLAKFNIAKLS
jgi:hypothetical protein